MPFLAIFTTAPNSKFAEVHPEPGALTRGNPKLCLLGLKMIFSVIDGQNQGGGNLDY